MFRGEYYFIQSSLFQRLSYLLAQSCYELSHWSQADPDSGPDYSDPPAKRLLLLLVLCFLTWAWDNQRAGEATSPTMACRGDLALKGEQLPQTQHGAVCIALLVPPTSCFLGLQEVSYCTIQNADWYPNATIWSWLYWCPISNPLSNSFPFLCLVSFYNQTTEIFQVFTDC